MKDRISNLMMEVSGIYIYKNNHMVLDIDKIISNIIDDLKAEIQELKAENENLRIDNVDYINYINKLVEENEKLKAELSQLKADNRHDAKVCEEYDDDLIKECKELQEENERLKSNSLKNSSLKGYKAEAEDYFHHNPKAEKVTFYMIDDNEGCIDYDELEQYEIGCINNDNS